MPDSTAGPKVAHFDRVEWHVIPDAATAAAALRSGEMDWLELATSDLLPFSNAAFRRALLGAIDQTQFMMAAVGTDPSIWHVPCGFFAPDSPMASDAGMDVLAGTRNLDEVRRRLQAAGYNGEVVALMVATDYPTLKALCDVAAATMRMVGLNVDYQAIDSATMVQRRASKKPVSQGGWSLFCSAAVEGDILTPATHPTLRGNGEEPFAGWPTSPGIESLREQWLDAADPAEQTRLAAAIQRQAFADVPYYPLGFYHRPTAYRTDLTGLLDDIPVFWNVRRT